MAIHVDRLGLDDELLVAQFLLEHTVRILNVAGNAEQTAPGIGELTEKFLLPIFTCAVDK